MNQINAVRRLLGYDGISHDGIDFALLRNKKDVPRALNYFTALMRGESYPSDENAFAPTVSDSAQPTSDARRAEIRMGGLVSVTSAEAVKEAENLDRFRAELREKGRAKLYKIRSELGARSKKFLAELGKRSELRDFVMSDEFSDAANKKFGEFVNPAPFVTSVRTSLLNAMMPEAFAAETVDPVIAKIVRQEIPVLDSKLNSDKAEGALSIALDLSDDGLIKQFLEIPPEKTSRVNEIAVRGRLNRETRTLLRGRGVVSIPQVLKNRRFEPLNTQDGVPFATRDAESLQSLSEVFEPLIGDFSGSTDIFVRVYMNRLMVVAAILLADIKRGAKKSGIVMTPAEIRDALLKRLNMADQQALITLQGRSLMVSSAAVEVYLKMQVEKSIQSAA